MALKMAVQDSRSNQSAGAESKRAYSGALAHHLHTGWHQQLDGDAWITVCMPCNRS